ncbi:MAG: hypothetical protein IKH05_04420 [Bacteroidaceae bacterium]|nr:hypothetical protein [Bacteroidaceae bacterium]
MKKKSIISLLICCMTLGMVNTSCQDMLTPDSERHAYEVAQDTLYSYWGIIKSLQNVAERYVILNECRGDLVDGTSYVSDTIAAIINFGKNGYEDKYKDGACAYLKVSDYYHVINSCNAYIAMCDTARKVSTGQGSSYMLREYAQVMAIRAWVYMQLIYAYGEVPFYTKPLLTTDEIDNFVKSDKKVNATTLAEYLGPQLDSVNVILEKMFGEDKYPQYGSYKNICHSMRVMFPIDVVLGDLYLLKGDDQACAQAAGYYYNFLNSKFCGPLETTSYYSTGDVETQSDEPQYAHTGVPYNETGNSYLRGRYRNEAITCIPSNTGKLEGKVFTDINRLFGFEATLHSSGSGDQASSSVSLDYYTNGYRRELIPSKGYEALCDSQNYECYIGQTSDESTMELITLPGVGDARRSWIYRTMGTVGNPRSSQYSLPVGDNTQYGKLVNKQCPSGFSTVYPLIYRKSTIWLRYAEAINRAGFPSYAFAILKTGLVSDHSHWFPSAVTEDDYNKAFSYQEGVDIDFGAQDSLYCYIEETADTTYKWGSVVEEGKKISTFAELVTYVDSIWQAQADSINANMEPGGTPIEARTFDLEKDIKNVKFYVKRFNNYPAFGIQKACWYLDRREIEKATARPWLTFTTQVNLRGYSPTIYADYKRETFSNYGFYSRDPENVPGASKTEDYLTIGVHQRGCGILRPGDTEQQSSYNYVDMVTKKIKENHGVTVTKDQIYGQDPEKSIDPEWVKEAVEDLIIDEDALELAFEGCRFSDLARVAIRRGDNSFLAKHVAKRSGTMDMKMYNILLNRQNWYLPFPTE